MTAEITVTLPFAGEERAFALPIDPLRTLQRVCDAGPMWLNARFLRGDWRVDDVRETLRQGLIGAGMTDADSTRLMKDHFDGKPLAQFVSLAEAITAACVTGVEGTDLGERDAGAVTAKTSPAGKSTSRPSSGRRRSSPSTPAKSGG